MRAALGSGKPRDRTGEGLRTIDHLERLVGGRRAGRAAEHQHPEVNPSVRTRVGAHHLALRQCLVHPVVPAHGAGVPRFAGAFRAAAAFSRGSRADSIGA